MSPEACLFHLRTCPGFTPVILTPWQSVWSFAVTIQLRSLLGMGATHPVSLGNVLQETILSSWSQPGEEKHPVRLWAGGAAAALGFPEAAGPALQAVGACSTGPDLEQRLCGDCYRAQLIVASAPSPDQNSILSVSLLKSDSSLPWPELTAVNSLERSPEPLPMAFSVLPWPRSLYSAAGLFTVQRYWQESSPSPHPSFLVLVFIVIGVFTLQYTHRGNHPCFALFVNVYFL